MMEFESSHTTVIAAYLTSAALILNSHAPDFLPSLLNCAYQVLATIAIFALLGFSHPSSLPTPSSQSLALPTELQGNDF
jgi:hypothetical protein